MGKRLLFATTFINAVRQAESVLAIRPNAPCYVMYLLKGSDDISIRHLDNYAEAASFDRHTLMAGHSTFGVEYD